MPFLAIVGLSILAAVLYGIAHDQITARICVEYFTIFHPWIIASDDPTILGVVWGVVATWWVGLILGVPLAIAARWGDRPQRGVAMLIRPIAGLLGVMAACAAIAGVTGWLLARSGAIRLTGALARSIPESKHAPFLADLWAHNASYLVGFLGGALVIYHVWRSRGPRLENNPPSPLA